MHIDLSIGCICFFDQLQEFCELGYDYIDAPWLGGYRYIDGLERRYLYVGNGGVSLRRVSPFLDILDGEVHKGITEPEDVFWASRKELVIAPVEAAISFAFEGLVRKSFELNHRKQAGSAPVAVYIYGNPGEQIFYELGWIAQGTSQYRV